MTIDVAHTEDAEARLAALIELSGRARALADAVVLTDVPGSELTAVAAELAALTERLGALRRDAPRSFELGPGGVPRNVGNAVTGSANPHALPLVVRATPERTVRAELDFRPVHEGPPASVHGGVSAMVLDHLLGEAAAVAGFPGVTGTLTLRYRRPVPYGEPLVATAECTGSHGRKTWVEGRIALADGTPLVEASGLFVTPAEWLGRGPGAAAGSRPGQAPAGER
ncbi:PaaI family thioesterase [Planomonospora sp. ID82291]|uniref:PaaI family thioesterase n=1 Tax=Planomonospora sp. ID82291 TaxID=2738136 RepID=UPI0018C43DAF|nr:PaaI family thioesterase [Planomonospora sp. ID82291]MBG0815824.1 PaaI family thioesterase [Planomonospora sp. ID82291]